MMAILTGVGVALVTVVLHVAIVRWLPQRRYISIIGVLTVVAIVCAGFVVERLSGGMAWEACLLAAVLALSLIASYAVVFFGIGWDSPTLALVNAIADRGGAGMPVGEIQGFIARHPFIRSRVDALIASHAIADEQGMFSARGDVGILVGIAEIYRSLCGQARIVG